MWKRGGCAGEKRVYWPLSVEVTCLSATVSTEIGQTFYYYQYCKQKFGILFSFEWLSGSVGQDLASSLHDKIGLISWWRQHLLNWKKKTERKGKKRNQLWQKEGRYQCQSFVQWQVLNRIRGCVCRDECYRQPRADFVAAGRSVSPGQAALCCTR